MVSINQRADDAPIGTAIPTTRHICWDWIGEFSSFFASRRTEWDLHNEQAINFRIKQSR